MTTQRSRMRCGREPPEGAAICIHMAIVRGTWLATVHVVAESDMAEQLTLHYH